MKNLITIINLAILFAITSIFSQSDKLREDTAETMARVASIDKASAVELQDTRTAKSDLSLWSTKWNAVEPSDDTFANFLREMTEARIMDLEQGRTASQRATQRPLKDYGTLMIKDQSKMLDDLKKLAARKNVAIPVELGPEKTEALADLRKVHGKNFDKKFIKMMINDHKRDAKKLEKASLSSNAEIQVFATKYLPVVRTHLDKIKALKKMN